VKATWIALGALIVAGLLIGMAAMNDAQDQRRCMSALATPGVEDPAYDEKAIAFSEGIERCMQTTP
jgi:hypothetical protein